MRALHRNEDTPLFVPDFMAKSVLDIDFEELKKQGIRFVAFDADSTLVPYRAVIMNNQTQKFLKDELKHFEEACIASNRVTDDLANIAEGIGAEVIRASLTLRKPARGFYQRVIKHFDAKPREIVMIGDKLVADIYGGNLAGLRTVWVEQNGRDGILDRIFQTRKLERHMMRRFAPKTEN